MQAVEGSGVTEMQVALQVKAPQPAGETHLLFVRTRTAESTMDTNNHLICEDVLVEFR